MNTRFRDSLLFFAAIVALLGMVDAVAVKGAAPGDESTGTITVHLTSQGKISPQIFGHFSEETLTSWEGGISSELLYNRKFEIPEEREPTRPWFKGTAAGWAPVALDGHITLLVDSTIFYSPSRSQRIMRTGGALPAGIQQSGFQLVMTHVSRNQRLNKPFHFGNGQWYRVRVTLKNRDLKGSVVVGLGESYQSLAAAHEIRTEPGTDWKTFEFDLKPNREVTGGEFMVFTNGVGTFWVDSLSLVRGDLDERGFRKDAVDLTRRLQPSNIRWPGGWFVSDYHWIDGIGPIDKRPSRFSRIWDAYINNDVGVDDYLRLCQMVGCSPYIVVNVGTGTPEEAASLVEYVNGSAHSRWGRLRATNGHPEPYKVRFWNIGNEEYLPNLGATNASAYAQAYLAFARAMKAVDPTIQLVAVGGMEIPENAISRTSPMYEVTRYIFDWAKQFLPAAGKEANYYSIHYYEPGDSMHGKFTQEQVDLASMAISEDLGRKLQPVFAIMDRTGRHLPVALDEWSMKLPESDMSATAEGESRLALRDALAEATIYNLMQRHPSDFGLASRTILYAYSFGIVAIGRDSAFMTPPGEMLELYSTRDECDSLQLDVESPGFNSPPVSDFAGAKNIQSLDVSARIHPDGHKVDIFVVNRNLELDVTTKVRLVEGNPGKTASISYLDSKSLSDRNSFEDPLHVRIQSSETEVESGVLTRRFPAHSITKITLNSR